MDWKTCTIEVLNKCWGLQVKKTCTLPHKMPQKWYPG